MNKTGTSVIKTANKKDRILLIAYSYPPLFDPQSIRWFNLSNLLAKKGYDVDVVTIRLPYGFMEEEQFIIDSHITIFRIFPGPFEYISYSIKAKIGTDKSGNLIKRKKTGFKLSKSIYWIARKAMNNILIGDLRTEWMPFCHKFLRKVNLDRYSVLITSQEPFVDSLIGLKIKKANPDIFWIADIGDSVLSEYYPKWRKSLDSYLEKKIVNTADKVVVTNKHIVELLSKEYNTTKNKFSIITQGFCHDKNKTFKEKNKCFIMLFAGTFYENFREPAHLIEALEDININFKLIIAGRNENFMDRFRDIKDRVEFLGFIPYFESLKLQKMADVLINIGNRQTYQVPGKFFEYLGSRKPILNIVYTEEDETAKLVKQLNVGITCKNQVEDIKTAVLKLYNLWKNNEIDSRFNFNNKDINQYSWENGANKLNDIINSIKDRYIA